MRDRETDHLSQAVVAQSVDPDPVAILDIRAVVVSEGNPCTGPTKLCNRQKMEKSIFFSLALIQ